MNPLYFGTRRRLLFGIYHPPTGRPVEPVGVVLCPPLALEYMRSYRTLRQLGVRLAQSGFHVLRFDYHGTGDSGGDAGRETLADWRADVEMAMQELGDLSGVARFTLVGVRFGAVLAARAAAGRRPIEDLVFWDPAVDGSLHARWLRRRTSSEGRASMHGPVDANGDATDRVVAVDGFPMSTALLREIESEDLATPELTDLSTRRIIVASAWDPNIAPLLRLLGERGARYLHRPLPDEASWEDIGRQGSIVLAPRAVKEIVDALTAPEEAS